MNIDSIRARFNSVVLHILDTKQYETKSSIARCLDTKNHVIGYILREERNPTVKQCTLLCRSYVVNANYLFKEAEPMFSRGLDFSGWRTYKST